MCTGCMLERVECMKQAFIATPGNYDMISLKSEIDSYPDFNLSSNSDVSDVSSTIFGSRNSN